MKIKSFEYPKSIKNYKKNTLNIRRLVDKSFFHRPSEPAYYIVDCWILIQVNKNDDEERCFLD